MEAKTKRSFIQAGYCLVLTALFLFLYGAGFAPLQEAEWSVQDWRLRLGRKTPVDPRLVLIGIDRPSYASDFSPDELAVAPVLEELRRQFPWSRQVWAVLIEKLLAAGARTVVIDLVFAGPGPGDAALREVLAKHAGRVVIGSSLSDVQTDRGKFWRFTPPHPDVLESAAASSALDARVGFVNIWPDPDQIMRRAAFRLENEQLQSVIPAGPEAVTASLAARALQQAGFADRIPSDFSLHRFRYTAPPGLGYRPHPVGDVLSPRAWERNYGNGEFFRDKIILIGPTDARSFHDDHSTPFAGARMVGPEIHLNIIGAALQGELLRETSRVTGFALIAGSGLLAAWLCRRLNQPVKRLGLMLVLAVLFVFVTQLLFNGAGFLVLTVSPLLLLLGLGLAALTHDFIHERLERLRLRTTMSYYFSPRVLEEVLSNPGSMQPRAAEVTVLLTDLRNSTPLAETLGPGGMFDLFNRVFEAQTGAIMSEEGNLEHFLGDQFLSYWGAPQEQPDAPERALRAARKLISAMQEVKAGLAPAVRDIFGYGVALHKGSVLCGNKGSAMRLDYGLVGDTINEAARVEALTKFYGVMFLVTGELLAALPERGPGRLVDRVVVKGKTAPVELTELSHPASPARFEEICSGYEAAFALYLKGEFATARGQFQRLADEFGDKPSALLASRCAALADHPPPAWDGVHHMEAK